MNGCKKGCLDKLERIREMGEWFYVKLTKYDKPYLYLGYQPVTKVWEIGEYKVKRNST